MFEQHFQNAYVTRDLDMALDRFRQVANIRHEFTYDGEVAVTTPDGPGLMHTKIALLWVDDIQYEFIQPVGGNMAKLYADGLPAEGDGLAFHHVCMRVKDWDDFKSTLQQRPFPLVLEGEAGPLKYLYLDARPLLGHYLEYICMPDEVWAATGGR